jgi:hypothetical protein
MKKILIGLIITSLLVFSLGVVGAQEDVELPEAKKVGFFSGSFGRIGLAFTFNKEKQIEKSLELAEKRLAEAEKFAEDDPKKAEKARERYEFYINRAQKALEKMSSKEAKDSEGSKDGLSKLVRAQNRLETHKERADGIYLRTIERLEENNASEEKIAKFEELFRKMTERFEKAQEKLDSRKEDAKGVHKRLSKETDEELAVSVANIEKEEGLTDAREKRQARAELRVKKFTAVREKEMQKIQTRMDESNLTDEQKERLQRRIDISTERTAKYAERARETQARAITEKLKQPLVKES